MHVPLTEATPVVFECRGVGGHDDHHARPPKKRRESFLGELFDFG